MARQTMVAVISVISTSVNTAEALRLSLTRVRCHTCKGNRRLIPSSEAFQLANGALFSPKLRPIGYLSLNPALA